MDVNILITRLRTTTLEQAPTALMLKAAQALEQLVNRVNQDQQTIMNLQHQINQLLEQLDEQSTPNQTVAEASGEAG